MTNVLVTGAAGFIGSHVAEYYANQNEIDRIFVVDNISRAKLLNREIKGLRYNWELLKNYEKISFYEKDIRDFNFLKDLFKANDVDIVIHAAAQTAVTTSVTDPLTDFENNALGSFNILEAVRLSDSDPSLILCSTNKVFGNNVNNCRVIENASRYKFSEENSYGIPEDFPIDLCEHTPYGTSKLCSDLYFQEYGHLYGMKTAVYRMSCIYGTRQFGLEDQGWIAHFIISAITDKKIKIFGDGKQVRDVLYISDLIQAYNNFIRNAEKIKSQVFCMGGGPKNTLSLLELINILEKELDKKVKYEFHKWRPSDQKVYISDIRKAKRILRWEPEIKPGEGIIKLVKWVKNNIELFH